MGEKSGVYVHPRNHICYHLYPRNFLASGVRDLVELLILPCQSELDCEVGYRNETVIGVTFSTKNGLLHELQCGTLPFPRAKIFALIVRSAFYEVT